VKNLGLCSSRGCFVAVASPETPNPYANILRGAAAPFQRRPATDKAKARREGARPKHSRPDDVDGIGTAQTVETAVMTH